MRHLDGLREERKAIIMVSEGWQMFRDDLQSMPARKPGGRAPTGPGIIIGPGGRPGTSDPANTNGPTRGECDGIRMQIAAMDIAQQFRDLPDVANRANASFYTIDPRGLAAFDAPIGPTAPPPVSVDQANLRNKLMSMRELAERTDGLAAQNSNDLNGALARIGRDLSSYYLIGYDSTNPKLDGTYRAIKMTVKRPGVEVRARRGYRAPIDGTRLRGTPRGRDVRLDARGAGGTGGDAAIGAGGAGGRLATPSGRRSASAVSALASTRGGPADQAAGRRGQSARGARTARARRDRAEGGCERGLAAGRHRAHHGAQSRREHRRDVRSAAGARRADPRRRRPAAGHAWRRVNIVCWCASPPRRRSITWATASQSRCPRSPVTIGDPLVLRRGPSTGVKYVPTADLRFRRQERVRLEAPFVIPLDRVHATLVSQAGQPMPLPVQVTERVDGASRIAVIDVSLAPLAAGGYAIMVTDSDTTISTRVLVPLQIIP